MTMRNLALGVLTLAVAASAEARLSEGEAAIVGGIIGYGLSQNRPSQSYTPPPVYVQPQQPVYIQQAPVYNRQLEYIPRHRHQYNFTPNQYPGIIS